MLPVFRRRAVPGLLAGLTIAASCSELDNIDVDASGRASVPAKTVLDDLIALLPFEGFERIDFEHELANQGVSEEQVDSVRVKELVLSIESPDQQTFEFLDEIAFFASAEGLPEVRIASAAAFDPAARRIELTIDDTELREYATAAAMTIRAEVTGRRPDRATVVRADVVFDVDIAIPGC